MSRKDKRRITYEVLLLTCLVGVLFYYTFITSMNIHSNTLKTTELEKKYVDYLKEEKVLESEVVKLQDEDYLARYARENFFFSKEGELIIRIP